ncbi:hypothetical protein C4D60_Mb10t11430 [Musa balbisiana]|uniref:Uncharacterized protein n=1 Tax=Musa balbisiana TaxID=52838 RepID=A0A4V4H4R4_MUSBA|nr:hypothetical protein C4D60_Mb10t11430 [Musa balbisiana]
MESAIEHEDLRFKPRQAAFVVGVPPTVGPRRRSTAGTIPFQDWNSSKLAKSLDGGSTGTGNGGVRHRHISLLAPLASNFAHDPFLFTLQALSVVEVAN